MAMKFKYVFWITMILVVFCIGFGLYFKTSYKDYNKEEQPLDNFKVGLMSENLVDIQINHMKDNLDALSNYIVVGECVDSFTYRFGGTSQAIIIKHVFKGDNLRKNERIEIVRFSTEIFMHDENSINMGFVNEMQVGKKYLIFLDRKVENTDNLYIQGEEFLIAPIFCYEEIGNTACKPDKLNYLVTDYVNVQKNEFFFIEDSSYVKMLEFKKELLEQYAY